MGVKINLVKYKIINSIILIVINPQREDKIYQTTNLQILKITNLQVLKKVQLYKSSESSKLRIFQISSSSFREELIFRSFLKSYLLEFQDFSEFPITL